MFLGAFGRWLDPVALLVAYGVANIVAALPITPNGLGVMEATLSGILVGFGTPRTIAIWGVISWRLVNFWLPIPLGGAAYLSLRVHPPAGDQAGLAARRAVWRTRWRWVVELFGVATLSPEIPDELAVIATAIDDEGGDRASDGVASDGVASDGVASDGVASDGAASRESQRRGDQRRGDQRRWRQRRWSQRRWSQRRLSGKRYVEWPSGKCPAHPVLAWPSTWVPVTGCR